MKAFILGTISLMFFAVKPVYADFEAIETALGKLEDIQKEAQNVQEELKEVQAKLNTVRQGTIGQLEEVSSSLPNAGKVDVKLLDSVSEKVGDLKGLEGAVEGSMLPQYTDKDQTQTYIETKNTVEAVRRENLSRMYAYALSLRANMEKNRSEGSTADEPVTTEDSREILQSALTKEAMENARRVARIWDMQAAIDELRLIEISQRYSNEVKEDDEAEGEEK